MNTYNVKKALHIDEFLKGKSVPVTGPHCIMEDGEQMPLNMELAILTHHFHNVGKRTDLSYAEKAEKILGDVFGADSDEDESVLRDSAFDQSLFPDFFNVPFPPVSDPKFTFIDLFAGIGGFRMAMQNLGGRCVFSSEWDSQAQKTYMLNYGEIPFGDITLEETKSYIPDGFDVLCAGFPCQAFSLAGKRRGFEETRGTLFFDVAEIIRRKQPKAFFLENVKGLLIHDKGNTIKTILKVLRDDLNYYVPDCTFLI